MPEMRAVDPHDDPALRSWYAILHAGATDGRPAPLLSSYQAMAVSFRDPGPARRRLPVAAYDGDTTVGALLLEWPLTENLTTAEAEIAVAPGNRRRGIGSGLWRWAVRHAAADGRAVLQAEVHVPEGRTPADWPGSRFAEHHGGRSMQVEDHLVADLPRPAATPEVPAGYEAIGWTGPCPPEHRTAFAAMHSVMSADVPSGELHRETETWDAERIRVNELRLARSYRSVVSLVRTTAGEPAGYTQLLVPHVG